MTVPVCITGKGADLQGVGPAVGRSLQAPIVLRRGVGAWSAGTRVVVRGWRVDDPVSITVSPECQPSARVEVSMWDLVPLRRRGRVRA